MKKNFWNKTKLKLCLTYQKGAKQSSMPQCHHLHALLHVIQKDSNQGGEMEKKKKKNKSNEN